MSKDLLANMKKADGSKLEIAAALMYEIIEVEVPECKRRCPKLHGDLEKSINGQGPFLEGNNIKGVIRAGEPGSGAEDYAVIQHEDLDFYHPVGGPKFIEGPLLESAPYILQRVANRVDLNKVFK